ncbi:MAG: FAD-dependent oxidoreductase [Rhodobacteraceae bacterium]|nr:FAD-dependent oxidoreductase [Paracoccaceae bacterium]
MRRIRTDLLVIGAGSGGLSVAAGAARMGADVTLLEGGAMGGDCLNAGCVPSKALLAAARAAHGQTTTGEFGIAPVRPDVDYRAAMEHVAGVIASIAPADSQERFEALGVRVIREYGHFVSANEVRAGDTAIAARRIVIATGSAPLLPPIRGLDTVPYLTNETLFGLRERPDHLLIAGGGPIGMEMAQAHVRLGARVTVIEGDRILNRDDPDLVAVVRDRLSAEGVEIVEGAMLEELRKTPTGIEALTADGRRFHGSHLLMALGRRANTDRLNLATAGIETTKSGILVDDRLRSTNRRVHAIGDVAGGLQFTHVAGYHAGVVIRSALFGLPARARTDHIPRVTYTDPELAQAGLSEAEARERYGDRLEVVRLDLADNDRATAERRTAGFIKIAVVRGRPVGVSIVGHQAGELINLWALVLANRMKMSQVAAMVSPYPTFGEVNKRAAGAYFAPRLFQSRTVKRVVGLIQKWLP